MNLVALAITFIISGLITNILWFILQQAYLTHLYNKLKKSYSDDTMASFDSLIKELKESIDSDDDSNNNTKVH